MEDTNLNRRDFLKLIIAAVGTLVGAKVGLKSGRAGASPSAPQGPRSWAMVIDQDKCNGCTYCQAACRASNDIAPNITWNKLYQVDQIGERDIYLSVGCMQCENAPCVSVCPVGASYYRDDGIVMMDYDRCIGCRYCQIACPYDARSFNWQTFSGENPAVPTWGEPDISRRPRGVVEKCSFCFQRIDRGLAAGLVPGVDEAATPACVNACPSGARLFGDLNDPASPVSLALAAAPAYRIKEHLGTHPRVYYLNAQRHSEEQES
ncbi:MAG: 4Fe-4S dicluster domain-containing protein [Anaerolineae bacterium]|nr:4Fe-4S dicluster domain-containing protein [Anaerolineae bacterium]